MDTVPGLKALQERKRVLLVESDLHRHVIKVELARMGYALARYRRGYFWVHSAWRWAAPLAGFLLARKFKKTAGSFAKGSALLGMARSLWTIWSARRNGTQSADAPPPHSGRL